MDSNLLIETIELTYTYDSGVTALNGLNIKIRPEEFVAFIGGNGSGKTTLLKHFNGLHKPTSGRVIVDGIDTKRTTVSKLSRTVALVFQNPDHQIFSYTVWDEILFGLNQYKIPREDAEERAVRALKAVGLDEMRQRHPRELSRGQRQRLATASMLALETKVLALDEPTTGQDFLARRQIMTLAADLQTRGRTILMVTHDMALVAEYATRAIVLKDGEVLMDAPPKEVFQEVDALSTTGLKIPPFLELIHGLKAAGLPVTASTFEGLGNEIFAALP